MRKRHYHLRVCQHAPRKMDSTCQLGNGLINVAWEISDQHNYYMVLNVRYGSKFIQLELNGCVGFSLLTRGQSVLGFTGIATRRCSPVASPYHFSEKLRLYVKVVTLQHHSMYDYCNRGYSVINAFNTFMHRSCSHLRSWLYSRSHPLARRM